MNVSNNEVRKVINHVSAMWKMFGENIDAMEVHNTMDYIFSLI